MISERLLKEAMLLHARGEHARVEQKYDLLLRR
jgi:hypothetical protein